jgi:hypothetical protein
MKLISVLKNLLLESVLIKKFDHDGLPVVISQTYESMRSTIGSGSKIRVSIDEIMDSMSDMYDIIIDRSLDILESCDENCDLVVRDYRPGLNFDYQLFLEFNKKKDSLKLTINTSIRHPEKLRNKVQQTPELIITKEGDPIIRESIDDSFTYKKINDIIIYYTKYYGRK